MSGKYLVLNKCSLLPVGIKFIAIAVDISIFSLHQFPFPRCIKKAVVGSRSSDAAVD